MLSKMYILTFGMCSMQFKQAVIILLHKSGRKKDCSNYRYVAFTLSIAKIFEKCLKTRLIEFLTKHNFFSQNQFGFPSSLSTINASYYTYIVYYN